MKRMLAAAAAVGLVLAGLAVTPATAAPAHHDPGYTPPPVEWGKCEIPRLVQAGAECGFVVVPLDYDKPRGEKIKLAVSRIMHKSSNPQGPMLVNPGGPGGSGLIYAIFGDFVPDGGGDDYDWVGFDTRGVGSSEPALSCDPNIDGYNRPFYVPVTRSIEQAWLAKSAKYAKDCKKAGGKLLDNMTTVDFAKDLDNIRKALKAPKINYYGFSYGTYLGQVYGTMFPDKLRRVIWDGNVDPTQVWYDSNIDQDIAFDKNSKVYFDWIAKYDDVYGLGDTGREVQREYYKQFVKLSRNPAGGKIGGSEWNDIFLQAAYYVYGWEDVASAFKAWVKDGDAQPLIDLYGGPEFADNGHAVYLAVICSEGWDVTNYDKYKRDMWRTFAKAPFATWGNAWFNGPCLTWPAESSDPINVKGSKVGGVLLINETLDSATPYSGALEVRKRFPKSVLIEGVGGTTHSGSLSGVACVDDAIVDYLKTGKLPARKSGNRSDVQCDPVPQPVPSAAAARTAKASGVDALRKELTPTVR